VLDPRGNPNAYFETHPGRRRWVIAARIPAWGTPAEGYRSDRFELTASLIWTARVSVTRHALARLIGELNVLYAWLDHRGNPKYTDYCTHRGQAGAARTSTIQHRP
jgi:hypothetical protein